MTIGEKIKHYRGRISAIVVAALSWLLVQADTSGIVDVPTICNKVMQVEATE